MYNTLLCDAESTAGEFASEKFNDRFKQRIKQKWKYDANGKGRNRFANKTEVQNVKS